MLMLLQECCDLLLDEDVSPSVRRHRAEAAAGVAAVLMAKHHGIAVTSTLPPLEGLSELQQQHEKQLI